MSFGFAAFAALHMHLPSKICLLALKTHLWVSTNKIWLNAFTNSQLYRMTLK